ncbi:MAG TPA: DUF6438 domain-containing protein [Gemmatimonadales bacterium]|nr:DUF6438 domain-containing protein [Gemmatimonadales bacterium]
MKKFAIAALGLGLTGCAAGAPRAPAQEASEATGPAPAISLERTACFGTCPVYTISVSASGKVAFQGRAHVRLLGVATGQIPAPRVDSLLVELEKAGYFSFASRYASSEPACGRYVTDLPTAITTVSLRGRIKRIEHDHGCGAAPDALAVLEKRIDEVLGSSEWIGSKK